MLVIFYINTATLFQYWLSLPKSHLSEHISLKQLKTQIFEIVSNLKKKIINTLNFIQYWRIFHQNFIFQETYYSTPWIVTNTTSDIIKQPAVDAEDDDIGTIVGVIIALLLVALIAGILLVYMR